MISLILRKINFFKNKFYLRKFKNYEEAYRYCNKITKNVYQDDYLNQYRLEKFLSSMDNLDEFRPISFNFLKKTVDLFFNKYNFYPKILDIGGCFGENSIYLQKIYKDKILYSICETPKIVNLSKKINLGIFYYSNIPSAIKVFKPDLIYSSSTLQYLSNPYDAMKSINDSNAKIISLTRNSFAPKTHVFSQPTNLKHSGIGKHIDKFKNRLILLPHTTIEKCKMEKIFSNYQILIEENADDYKIMRESYCKNLVFIKF